MRLILRWPSCGALQERAGLVAERQRRLIQVGQVVKAVGVDFSAAKAKELSHILLGGNATIGRSAILLPTKHGHRVGNADRVSNVLPTKALALTPCSQSRHVKRTPNGPFPLWLYGGDPLWQYANSDMRQIGYLVRVANDDLPKNRIRELREALGLSQAELARRANVTPSALNKLEMGRRGLDQHWMQRLAPLLDVAPADLLPTTDNPDQLADSERTLIDMFRGADDRQRSQILALVQALLSPADFEKLLNEAA